MGGGGKAPAPAHQRTPPCTPQPCLQRPPPHTRTHMRVGEGGRRFSGVVHQHRALAVGDDIGADCAGGWGGAWGVGEGGDARRSLRVRGRSGARCLCVATTQPPPPPPPPLTPPPMHSPPPPPHTHTHPHTLSPRCPGRTLAAASCRGAPAPPPRRRAPRPCDKSHYQSSRCPPRTACNAGMGVGGGRGGGVLKGGVAE